MKVLISYNPGAEFIETVKESLLKDEKAKVVTISPPSEMSTEISEAEVIFGGISRQLFLAAKKLKWIQTASVGVDGLLFPELVESDVIVTNTRGIRDVAMANHVFAMILAFSRRLNLFVRQQQEKIWGMPPIGMGDVEAETLGVVGLGCIGEEIAKRGKSFYMRVLVVDQADKEKPEFVDEIYKPEHLSYLLAESDYVVNSLPLTPQTRALFDESKFAMMKPNAYFINISRGPIVKESALVEALKSGKIAGAGLDVFEKEPLPKDSSLWQMPNVIITPHAAGSLPHKDRKIFEFFAENLRRYVSGQPLLNVVNKKMGF